jgi:hypothetical protein
MTPELESAIAATERTITALRDNSCERWATQLQQLLESVRGSNPFGRKEALFKIGEVCHPKALGDAHITTMDWQVWLAQLETLHEVCARAFNQLERTKT